MPCIWGQHNGSQLFLVVSILPVTTNIIAGQSLAHPVPSFMALVDTGATATGVSQACAAGAGLIPVSKVNVHGVAGIVAQNCYLFRLGFPIAVANAPVSGAAPSVPPPSPGLQQVSLHVVQKVIQGCEFSAGAGFDVLLGMDVLSQGSLVVQGNQTFSFSF
jgi:hypothetical protein